MSTKAGTFHGLYFPFSGWRLLAGLVVGGLGTALALRGRAALPLASIFFVWTISTVVFYVIPSAVGDNMLRPGTFVLPMMLLVAFLAEFKPRWLALPALAAALAANVIPYIWMIPHRSPVPTANASFWRPMLSFLAVHSSPGFRIEVVPTDNHWEAYFLPLRGYALARGYYTQLDLANNLPLYRHRLTPVVYRHWLHSLGVRYVLLPQAKLESIGADEEADLLRSDKSGLRRVFTTKDGTIYELPRANSILTGTAPSRVTLVSHTEVAGWVQASGLFLLRVRYMPYWHLHPAQFCLARAPNGMIQLDAPRAGHFTLQADESPTGLIATLVRGNPARCRRL